MHLYLIEQSENPGYDTYDSAVVCAGTAEKARHIFPDKRTLWVKDHWEDRYGEYYDSYDWTHPDNVTVTRIGKAAKTSVAGAILSSFNAGYGR
ncbi:MAG: hypothetical protein QNK40_16535 [Desulfobacterales bacterium]|nr:hypothetical protein [Desulfobacterales bacterium]